MREVKAAEREDLGDDSLLQGKSSGLEGLEPVGKKQEVVVGEVEDVAELESGEPGRK